MFQPESSLQDTSLNIKFVTVNRTFISVHGCVSNDFELLQNFYKIISVHA
jgi:hypothetical protein